MNNGRHSEETVSSANNAFCFQWHLTNRCTRCCTHCYQSTMSDADELPLSDLINIWNRIENDIRGQRIEVTLTGGEPFLYPAFMALLRVLNGSPSRPTLHIITNGTGFSDAHLRQIQTCERIDTVRVSLESACPGVNDRIRGAGHFQQAIAGIQRIQHLARKPVMLMMTLSERTADQIPDMIHLARKQGIFALMVERFVPVATGRPHIEHTLSLDQWRTICSTLIRICDVDLLPSAIERYQAFLLHFRNGTPALSGAPCHLGPDNMALMPDGTVFPCRRCAVSVGNLRFRTLSDIRDTLSRWTPVSVASPSVFTQTACRALTLFQAEPAAESAATERQHR